MRRHRSGDDCPARGNPHLPFPAPCSPAYPPKPGICPSPCCPGVADAPACPRVQVETSLAAPGPNFHAPAPHPTLGPGAPVHSAAALHFPAQYQALQMPLLHLPVHMLKQMPLHLPLHKPGIYIPFFICLWMSMPCFPSIHATT